MNDFFRISNNFSPNFTYAPATLVSIVWVLCRNPTRDTTTSLSRVMPVKEMEVHHDPCTVPGMHTTLINFFFIPHLFFFFLHRLFRDQFNEPQCNGTGPSWAEPNQSWKESTIVVRISVYTLDTFIFFLSHWELSTDGDNMCDEIFHPMWSHEWEEVRFVIMLSKEVCLL